MPLETRILASGSGWRVADVICTAGPDDAAFEEQHDAVCTAAFPPEVSAALAQLKEQSASMPAGGPGSRQMALRGHSRAP